MKPGFTLKCVAFTTIEGCTYPTKVKTEASTEAENPRNEQFKSKDNNSAIELIG